MQLVKLLIIRQSWLKKARRLLFETTSTVDPEKECRQR